MTRFRILGPVAAERDGEPLEVAGQKPRTVLALLLVADGRPVPAEQLITELWADHAPASVTTVLQVYVSGLRKLFGDRIQRGPGGYALTVEPGELDAATFVSLTDEARRLVRADPAAAAGKLREALGLWQGEPLSGTCDSPTLSAARIRLTERYLTAVEDRIDCDLALGRPEQLVAELAGLVSTHPLRERFRGQLMLTYHRCGRPADAERVFCSYRDLARTELNAEPSQRLVALAAAVRRGDPTLDTPSGPALPLAGGRFIGRRRELDRLEQLLGRTRLLTLTGPGGTGKTRLAFQLVRDVGAAEHPDGVHVVELAGTADEAAVTGRVATAVGARERPGEDLTASVVEELRYRRALLVLDNCEHVVEPAGRLVTALLQECPGLRLLTTSREPLDVPGETLVPVNGLRLPALDQSYEEAMRTEAVRLLADRGAAARLGFQIDPATIDTAIGVCRRLDGLPLAIELAAARLRVLTLPELSHRLGRRLDLQTGSGQRLPARHRTIRATIEWSHDLLDKPERALFRRLAVFSGGFTLAAAEQVGADPDSHEPHEADQVLELLSRLVNRSLVVPDLDGGTGRYRMLETIAEFASEQLAASTEEYSARRRHATWCAELMADAPSFGTDGHDFWTVRVPAELDNLRAAMDWALGSGDDPELAVAIGAPLCWYWWWSGQLTEGRDWVDRAMTALAPGAILARARASRAGAWMARISGDLTAAHELGEQALELHRRLGLRHETGTILNNLSQTALSGGALDQAFSYAAASRRELEEAGADRLLAWSVNSTGMVLRCLGRLEEAAEQHRVALELATRTEDHRSVAVTIYLLAFVAKNQGRLDEARRHYLDSLSRYRELRMEEAQVDVLEGLACVDVAAGRPAAALTALLIAERERRRLGVPLMIPDEAEMVPAALTAATASLDRPTIERLTREASACTLAAAVDRLLTSR